MQYISTLKLLYFWKCFTQIIIEYNNWQFQSNFRLVSSHLKYVQFENDIIDLSYNISIIKPQINLYLPHQNHPNKNCPGVRYDFPNILGWAYIWYDSANEHNQTYLNCFHVNQQEQDVQLNHH